LNQEETVRGNNLGNAKRKKNNTLERRRGEIPQREKQRARYSTIGVFPLPPQLKLPTLIIRTGKLHTQNSNNRKKMVS